MPRWDHPLLTPRPGQAHVSSLFLRRWHFQGRTYAVVTCADFKVQLVSRHNSRLIMFLCVSVVNLFYCYLHFYSMEMPWSLFICSSVERCLGYFQIFSMMSKDPVSKIFEDIFNQSRYMNGKWAREKMCLFQYFDNSYWVVCFIISNYWVFWGLYSVFSFFFLINPIHVLQVFSSGLLVHLFIS